MASDKAQVIKAKAAGNVHNRKPDTAHVVREIICVQAGFCSIVGNWQLDHAAAIGYHASRCALEHYRDAPYRRTDTFCVHMIRTGLCHPCAIVRNPLRMRMGQPRTARVTT